MRIIAGLLMFAMLAGCVKSEEKVISVQAAEKKVQSAEKLSEIIPKLKRIAGFELGTSFYINEIAPEEACESLKNI